MELTFRSADAGLVRFEAAAVFNCFYWNVANVRKIRRTIVSGVHFDTADGRYDGVIFWSLHWGQVLDAFEGFGWPAEI